MAALQVVLVTNCDVYWLSLEGFVLGVVGSIELCVVFSIHLLGKILVSHWRIWELSVYVP